MLAAGAAVLLLGAAPRAQAATFTIANGDVGALKAALTTANSNTAADTINLATNGSYTLTTVDNSALGDNGLPVIVNDVNGRDLTINGNGAILLRSSGTTTPAFRLLQTGAASQVIVNRLTLTNGDANNGGILGNSGGGIYNDHGTLTLNSCSTANNSGQYGGGIFNDHGTLSLSNCTLSGNSSSAGGGGLYNDGNSSPASATLTNCTISGNSTAFNIYGGGIYNDGTQNGNGALTLTGCTVSDNSANYGGGIYNSGSGGTATLNVTGSTFDGNNAVNGTFAGIGGAITNGGTASCSACIFTDNHAQGATTNDGGGGAFYALGATTLTDCTFTNNVSGSGGAIAVNTVALTATGCTLSNNQAGNGGGGLYNLNGTTTLTNCTVSGNSGGDAPGLINDSNGGTLNLRSCTITGNILTGPGFSSGVGNGSTTNVRNTIIAGNDSAAHDVAGTFVSGGYNLIGNGESISSSTVAGFTATGDQVGIGASPIDPLLGPLQNNGGATQTHALLPGSPAIDKGNSFGLTTDQRGMTRPYDRPTIAPATGGDNSDIGAFELGAPALNVNNPRSINEGSPSSPSSVTFDITLDAASAQTITVNYQTADGLNNPATAGTDYVEKHGKLTFAPGETLKRVTVFFIGDSVPELNETFFFDLKTPTNAPLGDSRGVGSIINDDGPSLTIEDAVPVNEGNADTTAQKFIVRLSAASTQAVTVDYATANGTAMAGSDFIAATGTLTFAPGQTSKIITIQVTGDTTVEPNETYKVNLLRPTYAVLADSQAAATINNDDATPQVFQDEPSQ